MSKKAREQSDIGVVPRFANINPFMRATYQEDLEGLDIVMLGVPFDLVSSFRTDARRHVAFAFLVQDVVDVHGGLDEESVLVPEICCEMIVETERGRLAELPLAPLEISPCLKRVEAAVPDLFLYDGNG